MSDIFAEVEEDLRAERLKNLMQRYGAAMIAAVVLVVLGTAAWKGWVWYEGRNTARTAAAYISASEAADGPAGPARTAAIPALEKVVAQGSSFAGNAGYRDLARMQLAALRWDAGAKDAALALWDQVAADGSVDKVLRDTARLQWALHQIDGGDPAQIQAHLQPLLDPANTLRSLAEEAQGLLALRQGKTADARAIFKRLSNDVTTLQGVRGRAGGLLAQLGE